MAPILASLAAAGYEGLLAVEIDHLHPDYGYDEHRAVRQSIDELRRLVGAQEEGITGNTGAVG
jgi:sugar phosphate isomerase/epimerase